MVKYSFEEQHRDISNLLDTGSFDQALFMAEELLSSIMNTDKVDNAYYLSLFNLAGLFIDIGSMSNDVSAVKIGESIMAENEVALINLVGEEVYYYNFANAKSALISEKNPFAHTFQTIEEVVELKNLYWKSLKKTEEISYELTVNLANSLKQQFRISEALALYDHALKIEPDCTQALVNRSETLLMLNTISSNLSIQMLRQISDGYKKASQSKSIPSGWATYYDGLSKEFENRIFEQDKNRTRIDIEQDLHETAQEFDSMSAYRQFCLINNLSLSEHGLYCHCAVSARDDLTIPNVGGIVGDFIVPMELVLNRLKSEFSFARKLYFDYLNGAGDDCLSHESCFSELFNDELLGIDVEKLRTSFKLCFGILDKIGVAVCELFDLYPPNKNVSFQSFWQLSQKDRRERFEAVKSPGLLALYSIASDLNDRKNGEWAFLKSLRNDLEHKFVVVSKTSEPNDLYGSYKFMNDMVLLNESELVSSLERVMQLTRSAIFSFTLAVRNEGARVKSEGKPYVPIDMIHQYYE